MAATMAHSRSYTLISLLLLALIISAQSSASIEEEVSEKHVAIFMLNTPAKMFDSSAKPTTDGVDTDRGRWLWGYDFYHFRTKGAKLTWGLHFPHLYFVWGQGNDEKLFFQNNTCQRIISETGTWHLHDCDGISILETIPCTDAYYGSTGPCCRYEIAINFFISMRQSRLKHIRWFIFNDDDIYWRPETLLTILSKYENSQLLENKNKPIAMGFKTTWSKLVEKLPSSVEYTRGFSDQHNRLGGEVCHVDCVHRFPWMQVSVLNMQAVEAIEDSMSKGGLRHLCFAGGFSHDAGVGLFLWTHSIPYVSMDSIFSNALLHGRTGYERGMLDRICSYGGYHGPSRTWDAYHLHELVVSCPSGSAKEIGESFNAEIHPNNGFNQIILADKSRHLSMSDEAFLKSITRHDYVMKFDRDGEVCLSYLLPPGVELSSDNRTCLCEVDGVMTKDGRCDIDRWKDLVKLPAVHSMKYPPALTKPKN